MDETQTPNRFTEAELIIGSFAFLGVDVISLALDLTGVGAAIAPVLQGAATFLIEWWVKSKSGSWGGLDLNRVMKYLSNTLPLLPTTFTIFLVSAIKHNHPEKFGALEKIGGAKNPADAAKSIK